MTAKIDIGRICEYLVKVIVETKSGNIVSNLNDLKKNHPVTDLLVINKSNEKKYEISVKSKLGKVWPNVRGIAKSNQYMVFVSLSAGSDPDFYILSLRQWNNLLKKIQPNRDSGGEIINGTIEWNWIKDGVKKKHVGTRISNEDLSSYKNKWHVLPGINE